jgi:hypothetical protein
LIAKLLLVLASTIIFGFKSHGTHDHILLPNNSGSLQITLYDVGTDRIENTTSSRSSLLRAHLLLRSRDFSWPLPSRFLATAVSAGFPILAFSRCVTTF